MFILHVLEYKILWYFESDIFKKKKIKFSWLANESGSDKILNGEFLFETLYIDTNIYALEQDLDVRLTFLRIDYCANFWVFKSKPFMIYFPKFPRV